VRYICVDALDEAADAGGAWAASIPRLLADAVGSFPPWLKLMVTTRPHDRVLPLFQAAEQCVLSGGIAEQRDDLRSYVDQQLAQRLGATGAGEVEARSRMIDAIADRSGGNFQYAEMVLAELSTGTLAASDIGKLPKSLAGLYHNRAESRFPDGAGYADARLVLGVLQAAREALSRSQLAAIIDLDRDEALLPLLRKLNCFVMWDHDIGEEGVYRIAHKSIGDWLLAPARGFDRFKGDLPAGRERLLAHCRGWTRHYEPYALRYLITHLLEGGLRAEVFALVREGFFERRRSHLDSNADFSDARDLTLALVESGDEAAILELARTDNIRQRDGIAAGLLTAPPEADNFVDRIVAGLLRMN
jgi:hypothetical protein